MQIYQIVGEENSDLDGMTFGSFNSRHLAQTAFSMMDEGFKEDVKIVKNMDLNTIRIDGKNIDLTDDTDPRDVLKTLDREWRVHGYVTVRVSDIIENDYEGLMKLFSERLIGKDILEEIEYEIVDIKERNEIVFNVFGTVKHEKY